MLTITRQGFRHGIGWVHGIAFLFFVTMPAWGAISTDVTVSTNRSSSLSYIRSPSFSTASAGELLLAFVATDANSPGITVTSVTGGGLTWNLVRRTNVQLGTAEIWRAFAPSRVANVRVRANLSQSVAASMTVVSFTGVDTSGTNGSGAIGATGSGNANPGAPTASLVTTRANSWVFGVGTDWDNAIARTVPADQVLVNQYLATVGDTYWVQRRNAPTPASGTTVTINDTAPATDRYNLTIVEVLAATSGAAYTVSGSITPGSLGSGATVTLSQSGTTISTATADATGNYSFTGIANGTYSVTPVKAGVGFTPASQSVTVNGGNATVPAFTATTSGTTYTVSGAITPASLGSGAVVTLSQSGTTVSTATADANGNYSFTGIADGTYGVTPAKAGIVFNPLSQEVTVIGGNTTVATFIATSSGTTYTVSGAITPGSLGSGATVTLSQGGTTASTATADANGNYSFTGIANGTYGVTPAKTGIAFNPPSQEVTVNGGNATVPAFTATSSGTTGTIATDVTVSTNRSNFLSNITSPTFSTASADELLLAFVATDGNSPGITVTSVTGGGLTWNLVRRTNVQLGTAEIWRAFAPGRLANVTVRANLSQSVAASMTVVSFTGVDTSGTNGSGAIGATGSGNANPGAPTASLVTTRANSWVFGVGTDWDNAIARTVPADQVLVNQYLATVGDTYWVQRRNAPTPASGTTVTINDTAPATDRYNLTIVEVLAATSGAAYTVSGSITPGTLGSGAAVTLSQGGTTVSTATADATGNYSFTGIANGAYSVTPVKAGVGFTPASQSVTVNGGNATVPAFTATTSGITYTVSGAITPASLGSGAVVTLSQGGTTVSTATADANGNYSFTGIAEGAYGVTPVKAGVGFTPTSQSVTVNGGNATVPAFTATSGTTYIVSGAITPGSLGSGAVVTLSQGGTTVSTATADANGNYSFTGVADGTYGVTPAKTGIAFTPTSQSVTVNGGNGTVAAFAAAATISGTISPAASGAGTLLVLNGPNLTLSKTSDSSGNYSFTELQPGNYTVTPSKTGYTFTPTSHSVTVSSGSVTANFTAFSPTTNLSVNGAQQFQTMDGMGVNINVNSWNNGQLKPALDFLVATNGSTLFRVVRDPMDWVASETLIPALHALDPTILQQVYETPKMQDLWNTIGYLNQKGIRGGQILLNFMGWTPTWIGGGGAFMVPSYITQGKEQEFATMVASLVYYGRTVKGLDFTYISPFNEADLNTEGWRCLEGPCVSSTQYSIILRALADELNFMGVAGLRFVGPDTAMIGVSGPYIFQMMSDSTVAGLTDHLALHDYSGAPASPGTAYPGKNYWLTETSAICTTCDEGGGGPPNEWIFATQTCDLVLSDIKNGFAAVLLWDGYDSFWYHHNGWDLSGVLAYGSATGLYTPRKRAYAYAQFNRFIEPGDIVIGASESIGSVPTIVAVYNPATGKVAIVGRNSGSSPITINGQVSNLPAMSALALYESSATDNLSRKSDVLVAGGTFAVQISADAIFSLTNQPIAE